MYHCIKAMHMAFCSTLCIPCAFCEGRLLWPFVNFCQFVKVACCGFLLIFVNPLLICYGRLLWLCSVLFRLCSICPGQSSLFHKLSQIITISEAGFRYGLLRIFEQLNTLGGEHLLLYFIQHTLNKHHKKTPPPFPEDSGKKGSLAGTARIT